MERQLGRVRFSLQSLSMGPNATLDLADNALIDSYAFGKDLSTGATYESEASTQMSNWLTTGYKGGLWTGPGIDSSVAAADLTHATGIGWMDNGFNYAAVGYDPSVSSFMGVSLPTKNQFLVRFAYYGDSNLDGQVYGSDGILMDTGYHGRGTGWVYGDFNYDGVVDITDIDAQDANYGLSTTSANYAPAFQPAGILINPVEGVPFSGDLATFTDILNPTNADPSIYVAQVNWGDGEPVAAQVTATSTPGSFRINAVSPPLTDPNAVMTVTIQYADMNDPSPTYQGRPAAVSEPVNMIPAIDDLVAKSVSGNEIDLTWNVNAGTLTAVTILSSPDGGQTWNTLATVTSGNSYQDTSVSEGISYQYQIQATEGNVTGPVSSTIATAYAIASPSDLVATPASDTEIDLSWNNPSYAASQTSIYISTDGSNFDDLADLPASQTSFQATGLDPRTTYTFYLVNSFAGEDSAPSASVSSKPNSVPTPVGLSANASSTSEIDLSWAAALNVAGYNIYRSTSPIAAADPNNLLDFDLSTTSYQDTGLDSSTTYYYLVTSVNAQGNESDASAPASATTPAAQITATGSDLSGPEGTDINGTIATFTDTQVNTTADDYTASIDWGDGNTSAGTIQMNDSGGFDIDASHAYQSIGDQTAAVTITHTDSGRTATATSTVHVEDPGITVEGVATSYPISNDAGSYFSVTTARFDSADESLSASDFTATIDWGDGTNPSTGTIAADGSGFTVSGIHAFHNPVSYAITTTVVDAYGAQGVGISNLNVLSDLYNPTFTDPGTWLSPQNPTMTNGTLNWWTDPYGNVSWNLPAYTEYDYEGDGTVWGVADALSGVSGYSEGQGQMGEPTTTHDTLDAETDVNIGSTLSVSQTIQPTADPNLIEVAVAIKNTSSSPVHLVYRELNPYYLNAQISGSSPVAEFDVGKNNSNPLDSTGDFPELQLNCDFGLVDPGVTQTFEMFDGITGSDPAGELAAVGSQVSATGFFNDSYQVALGFSSGPQYTADLQVDSNNDGTINSADDAIKDDPNKPGKIVVANTLDDTGNNLPGYSDSAVGAYTGLHNLADMELTTSDDFNSANATVTFHYSEADPTSVQHTKVSNSVIDHYDPGSTGALRLWDPFGRNSTSVAQGGDFIPDNVAVPWNNISRDKNGMVIYVEGVNPTDPSSTEITVDIDDGSGHIIHDAVRVTVASLQIVYTDVSGITHSQPDGGTLGVSRIAPDTQPDGVAADWMNGVDDGSALLLSVIGSPALQALYAESPSAFSFQFGQENLTSYPQYSQIHAADGYFHSLDDGFVPNATQVLTSLGIPLPGEGCVVTGLHNFTVLGEEFYRPPNEYGSDASIERRISPAVRVLLDGTELAQGAKPQGLLLTRPPLVVVHGIDSSPAVWFDGSQGPSFYDAVKSDYPAIFAVDHSGIDPYRPSEGPTYGTGEVTDMYTLVRDEISTATEAYREGLYFSADPYPVVVPGTSILSNALIAVQKVDVVAHSYGGILTRWYVEQSPEYAERRDVRKIIELGTPNLGSPLANMVDEIYRNPMIAAAKTANVFHDIVDFSGMDLTELETIALIQRLGILPTGFSSTGGVREFYEDDSVNSSLLATLASDGFNSDVGYAAVVGEKSTIHNASLYSALEPLGAFGESYFPWIVQFDGGAGQTDGVVPVWSAELGGGGITGQVRFSL